MPELGSLWYSVGLKDLTDADIKKINDKLKNLGSDLLINPKLAKSVTEILPKGIKLELDPQLKAVSNEALAKAIEGKVMKVEIAPLLTNLRKALKDATKDNPPEIEVGVQSAKLRTIIQNVLNKQGFLINITTVNDNYTKVVQQKLNGTRYTVKIHADAKEITRSVQASLMQVQSRAFGLQISRDILYRSIDDALGHKRFTINVAVQHDQARKAVQDALLRAQVIGKDQALAYQRLQTGELKAAQAELARLKAAHMGAADAAKAHATASINLGGALGSNTKIAGELSSAMASLYSVHAAKEFLSQVIEIGGELEHQKIAMDTIFGDKGKTSELFGQIKGLARQSPFGVMELTKSVKALSAYGVQYNEIYDTAKRLADISAATSVDINRLILAFGKTKSRGFLDGLEAKQFAYANIPIYEMVRRKLEELEGQAVTTAQVMERMKKREIGFDIVKDVLWDMTDEGGKFYNMQEALAGSVKTSWKLVRDNIELMFGEIAESAVGSSLKSLAEILQSLTREWRTVGTVVGTAAVGLGIYKIAQIGVNQVMQQGTAKTYEGLMAAKQRDAQRLRSLSLVMDLTAAEKARIATANRLTNAELAQALKTGKLTLAQIEQLFVTGKLNKANIMYLFRMGLIGKEAARAILTHNRLAISIKGVGMAMASAGKAIGAFLLNPWTIGIAALTTLIGLWQRHSEKIEETKENIKQLGETAREGAKSLSAEVEKLNAQNPETMVSSEFLNSIEEMKNVLKDYDPTWMDAFKEAFSRDEAGNVKSLAEQYGILKQAVIDTAEAYKYLNQIKDSAYDAQDETDGWFDDSMLENIKDFSDASHEYEKIVGKLVARSDMAERAVSLGMSASPAYALAAANKPLEEQIKLLTEYQDAWSGVFQGFNVRYSLLESWGIGRSEEQKFIADLMDLPSKIQDVNIALNSMQEDEGNFAEGLKSRLEGKWGDMEQWTEPMKKAVIKAVRDVYSKAEGVSKEEADKLANQTLTTVFRFRITTDFELDNSQLNDWKAELDNLTENQFTTIIRMAPDYLTALSEIQKATDEAQKQLDDAKLKMPIDIQFNGSFGMRVNEIPGYDGMSASQKDAANSMLNWLKQLAGARAGNITPTPQKSKGGASKDPLAESLKQRFKDIKDAWSEFQKWSKLEGREAAATRIGESGLFSTLSADKIPQTVEQYRALVVELENKLRQAGVKGTARESLLNDLLKQLLDIDKTVVDEQLKLALDKVSKEAERQLADWNLFDKIRRATGNQDLAMSIAFGMNATAETDYPAMIKQQFAKVVDQYDNLRGLTYDMITDESYLIDAPDEVKKAWEKAYNEIQKYRDKEREEVADMVVQYRNTQEEIIALTAEAEEKKRKIRESKNLTPVEKQQITAQIDADLNYEVFRKSGEYLKFFNAILSMTGKEAEDVGRKIKEALDEKLKAGRISAKDYCDEMERIDKQLEKIRQKQKGFGGLGSFAKGGLQQMFKDRFDQAQSDYNAATQNFDTAKQQFDLFSKEGNEAGMQQAQSAMDAASAMKEGASAAMQGAQGAMSTMAVIDTIVHGINDTVQGIKGSFDLIADMADSFGVDTSADTGWGAAGAFLDAFSQASQHATDAWDSLKSGNVGGVIQGVVGSVTSWFTTFNRWHDAKLQKTIDRSKQAAQIMQNQYDILEKRMANFLGNAANMKVEGYSGEGGAYGKQRELMQGQLAELEKQRQAELDKKKTDNSVVADYDKQIEEMKIAIHDFAIETAKDLYGIDLKSWASELGDALFDAWKKGESGADAFKRKAGEILGDVMNNVLKIGLLEPMMQDISEYLFGKDGKSGAFGSDFELTPNELEGLAGKLMAGMEGIDAYESALEQLEKILNEKYGLSMKGDEEAKGGLPAGIQNITEDTADLLASYLNGVRGDVSMQTHDLWPRLLDDALPQISVIAQSQLDTQRQIAENTLRNAVAAEAIQVSTAKLVELNDQMGRSWRRIAERNWGYS